MMDTFSRPLSDFYGFICIMSVLHIFLRFFAFVPITNEFTRCRNGCKHSLSPKYGSEIAFQASVLFLLGV